MSRNAWYLVALSALAPISVQVHTHGDTATTVTASDGTRFEVMAGAGEYAFVARGCEGQVLSTRPGAFRDAGVAIEQRIGSTGLSAGTRGGWIHDDIAGGPALAVPLPIGASTDRAVIDNRYINPYVTYEAERASIGIGWVAHDHEFITTGEGAREQPDHEANDVSWHLRLGAERRYIAARWMEGVPLASSGGYFTLGVGAHPDGSPLSVYFGMGAGGPYEGAGLMLQSGYRFRSGITANARTHLGYYSNKNASGVAIGVGYGTLRP